MKEPPKPLHKNVCQEQIFNGIYQKYARDLYQYLYYRYGEKLNPADKTQEAFLKLWEQCAKVAIETAKSYLYKVANNLTLNEIKHQKVVLRYQSQNPKKYTMETPEFLMQEEEYHKKFQRAISDLSEEQRVAFMLNRVEGKKHQEIAEMLGVTRKVVEYRIYSAFTQLKKVLKEFD
jgi:RNA polymerase sigma-70 factor (ECF subfamily)